MDLLEKPNGLIQSPLSRFDKLKEKALGVSPAHPIRMERQSARSYEGSSQYYSELHPSKANNLMLFCFLVLERSWRQLELD